MIYFDEVLLNYSCNNILKINIFSGSILGKMSRLNKGTVYRLNVVVKNIRRLRSIQTPILISYNHQISIDSIPYYYISSPQFLCEASPVEVHLQANTLAVQCRECMRDQQHNADWQLNVYVLWWPVFESQYDWSERLLFQDFGWKLKAYRSWLEAYEKRKIWKMDYFITYVHIMWCKLRSNFLRDRSTANLKTTPPFWVPPYRNQIGCFPYNKHTSVPN